MENNDKTNKKSRFGSLLKNVFYLLLILQFAPSIISNLKKHISEAMVPSTEVALLEVKGLIDNSSFYVSKIHEYLKDPNIKGMLLKIESPGGLPASSQAIFNELKLFKEEKPIVALIENVGASGGYYVACASDHIIANPSSLVGSIGGYMQLPNVKGLINDWHIKFNYIQSGKFKTAGSPLKDQTPEELEYLQGLSDNNYKRFVEDVAASRNLDIKQQDIWANGKVFTGDQAIKIKLIDEIGSQQAAINKIKELAKIDTEIKFIKPAKPSAFAKLFGQEEGDVQVSNYSETTATFLSEVYNKFWNKQTTPLN